MLQPNVTGWLRLSKEIAAEEIEAIERFLEPLAERYS